MAGINLQVVGESLGGGLNPLVVELHLLVWRKHPEVVGLSPKVVGVNPQVVGLEVVGCRSC